MPDHGNEDEEQFFWFAVVQYPSDKEIEGGAQTKVLVPPVAIFAKDKTDATVKGTIDNAEVLKGANKELVEVIVNPL